MSKHSWTKKTGTGNPKCGACGLIKELFKAGDGMWHAYYKRGNVYLEELDGFRFLTKAPPCVGPVAQADTSSSS